MAPAPNGGAYVLYELDSGQLAGTNPHFALARYRAGGSRLWLRPLFAGSAAREYARSMAVTPNGDVVVAGGIDDSTTLRGFVARISPAGRLRWRRIIDDPAYPVEDAHDVAAGPDGTVYVLGSAATDWATSAVRVSRYSPSGQRLWTQVWSNPRGDGNDYGVEIAARPGGGVVVAIQSEISGTEGVWVARSLSTAGRGVWTRVFDQPGETGDRCDDLALAPNGAVILGGTIEAGTTRLACAVKYTAGGVLRWAQAYWGTKPACEWGATVAVDRFGRVFLGATTNDPASSYGWAVMQMQADGSPGWLYELDLDGGESEMVRTMSADGKGNLYVVGTVGPTLQQDLAAVKLRPDGTRRWQSVYNGEWGLTEEPGAMALTGTGLFVAGWVNTPTTWGDGLVVKFKP